MSIENPSGYRGPLMFGRAHATALGGRITGVRETPKSDYTDIDVPIEGVSCVLPVGGASSSRRSDVVTAFRSLPLVHFAHGYAATSFHEIGAHHVFETETSLEGLVVGPHRRLTFKGAHVQQTVLAGLDAAPAAKAAAAAQDHTHRLSLTTSLSGLNFDGRPGFVRFRQLGANTTYNDVVRAVLDGPLSDALLPYSPFQQAKDTGLPIAVHLVEELGGDLGQVISGHEKRRAPNGIYFQDVGQVYFGELVISPTSSRYTLVRFHFGCHKKGTGTLGQTGTEGGGAGG